MLARLSAIDPVEHASIFLSSQVGVLSCAFHSSIKIFYYPDIFFIFSGILLSFSPHSSTHPLEHIAARICEFFHSWFKPCADGASNCHKFLWTGKWRKGKKERKMYKYSVYARVSE